ncbi:MAG: hypothetical protein MHM6MM_005216 [Cercozoa sp. M6MM]
MQSRVPGEYSAADTLRRRFWHFLTLLGEEASLKKLTPKELNNMATDTLMKCGEAALLCVAAWHCFEAYPNDVNLTAHVHRLTRVCVVARMARAVIPRSPELDEAAMRREFLLLLGALAVSKKASFSLIQRAVRYSVASSRRVAALWLAPFARKQKVKKLEELPLADGHAKVLRPLGQVDESLLALALTPPRSSAVDDKRRSYERLEYLGDAVYTLVAHRSLSQQQLKSNWREGAERHVKRLGSNACQRWCALKHNIHTLVRWPTTGKEFCTHLDGDKVLGDVVEALVACCFLKAATSGYDPLKQSTSFVHNLWTPALLANVMRVSRQFVSFRGLLLERLATLRNACGTDESTRKRFIAVTRVFRAGHFAVSERSLPTWLLRKRLAARLREDKSLPPLAQKADSSNNAVYCCVVRFGWGADVAAGFAPSRYMATEIACARALHVLIEAEKACEETPLRMPSLVQALKQATLATSVGCVGALNRARQSDPTMWLDELRTLATHRLRRKKGSPPILTPSMPLLAPLPPLSLSLPAAHEKLESEHSRRKRSRPRALAESALVDTFDDVRRAITFEIEGKRVEDAVGTDGETTVNLGKATAGEKDAVCVLSVHSTPFVVTHGPHELTLRCLAAQIACRKLLKRDVASDGIEHAVQQRWIQRPKHALGDPSSAWQPYDKCKKTQIQSQAPRAPCVALSDGTADMSVYTDSVVTDRDLHVESTFAWLRRVPPPQTHKAHKRAQWIKQRQQRQQSNVSQQSEHQQQHDEQQDQQQYEHQQDEYQQQGDYDDSGYNNHRGHQRGNHRGHQRGHQRGNHRGHQRGHQRGYNNRRGNNGYGGGYNNRRDNSGSYHRDY